jgi:hypothetical protein
VVSSITSDGDAHFNSLTFPAGGIADLRVKNEDLIITSTYVATNVTGVAENLTFADLNPFYATLNVTQQPALIYVVFAASCTRTDSAFEFIQFQTVIDGTLSGGGGIVDDDGDALSGYWINAVGCLRVTTTGNKVVKVQQRHWGNTDFVDCKFSAFWVPCSP